MSAASTDISEADILADVVAPEEGDLSPESARAILALQFREPALAQMRELLAKNNQGTLTPPEQAAMEKYRRVGLFLDLLQAKARLSLQRDVS